MLIVIKAASRFSSLQGPIIRVYVPGSPGIGLYHTIGESYICDGYEHTSNRLKEQAIERAGKLFGIGFYSPKRLREEIHRLIGQKNDYSYY